MFLSSRSVFASSANCARNWPARLVVLALFLLAVPILVSAQDATILGTVTDRSGGAIPDVAITITNTDTNISTQLTTNDVGQYVAPNLRIGTYIVRSESAHFKVSEQRGIALQLGDRRRVDFEMEVGIATET